MGAINKFKESIKNNIKRGTILTVQRNDDYIMDIKVWNIHIFESSFSNSVDVETIDSFIGIKMFNLIGHLWQIDYYEDGNDILKNIMSTENWKIIGLAR